MRSDIHIALTITILCGMGLIPIAYLLYREYEISKGEALLLAATGVAAIASGYFEPVVGLLPLLVCSTVAVRLVGGMLTRRYKAIKAGRSW